MGFRSYELGKTLCYGGSFFGFEYFNSGLLYFIFIERSFGFDVKLKVLITDQDEFYQHKLLKLLFGL